MLTGLGYPAPFCPNIEVQATSLQRGLYDMSNRTKSAFIIFRNFVISALVYSAIIVLSIFLLQKTWCGILPILNTPQFHIGLILVLAISFLERRLSTQQQSQINRYILLIVAIIVISIGMLFIILAYDLNLWANPPYNVSAFGAGVSVMAVGLAFLLALYPSGLRRRDVEEGENIETLNGKIKALLKESDRIEGIAKDCKVLVEELKQLREDELGADNQTSE